MAFNLAESAPFASEDCPGGMLRLDPVNFDAILNIVRVELDGDKVVWLCGAALHEWFFGHVSERASAALVKRTLAKGEQALCRALWKIEEAHARSLIALDCATTVCVDAGAAPGGWCQYLAPRCKTVFAIDPAEMQFKHERVQHIRLKIEDAVDEIPADTQIDLIASDIITSNIHQSCDIVAPLFARLKPQGRLCLTLKLTGRTQDHFRGVDKSMRQHFETNFPSMRIVAILQLFANTKTEMTLIAEKKQT